MNPNTLPADLDKTDVAMLRQLQADGRLSNVKLARSLHLSETACWRRLKRLESERFVRGYRAELDRRKLGLNVLAFVQLRFSDHSTEATAALERTVAACPEVMSCHNVSGSFDFMLQVVATDTDAYGRFIDTVLRKLPGVAAIASSLALRELKLSSQLPLP